MKASEIVAALEAQGARLRVVDERIDLETAHEPASALLDELRARKAAVLSFLAEREAPPRGPLPLFVATFSTFGPTTITPADVTAAAKADPSRYSTPRFWKDRSPRRL